MDVIEVERLISEVYSRPLLWDKRNINYHNRVQVEKMWICISSKMKVPKEDLKRKWKYLRDQFRAEWKKIGAKCGGLALSEEEIDLYSSWPYFKSLSFLRDQIKCRKFCGNLKIKKTKIVSQDEETLKENPDTEETTLEESEMAETDEQFDSFEIKTENPTDNTNSTNINSEMLLIDIEKRKLELLERNSANERDEDIAFFYSLIPHVRKLEPAQKLRCRIDIQNIVYKYVYETSQQSELKFNDFVNATIFNPELQE